MSKKLKKIICLLLVCMFFAVSAVSVGFVLAETQYQSINDIAAIQVYGTEYQIPKVKLDVNGEQVIAKTLLYKPDGTAVSGKSANLDQAGEYTLMFVANRNGTVKTEKKTFKVIAPITTFSSKGNTAQYYSDNEDSGLKISASSGTVATFSKVIDLSKITKENTFIRFKATPKFEGSNEIEKFEIKLTDIYDESNYLTFRVKAVSAYADKQVYIDAAASNQVFSARNRMSGKNSLYKNSQFGYTCFSNFYGQEKLLGFGGAKAFSTPYVELRYDNQELALYSHSPNSGLARPDRERGYENVITFSSLDDFDAKWGGFTDGKVRLSLKATGTAANYLVTDVYGIDLTELTVDDTEAPVLNVDLPQEIPTAVVDKEYTIFNASAYDVFSGERTVEKEVWFNYNGSLPISVAIKDGKFKTDKVGLYSIIYKAKDSFGNVAKQIVEVSCESVGEQITITPPESYAAAKQGDLISFKQVSAQGGSGELKITTSMQGGKFELTENGFIPYDVATYKVIYTATDYVGVSSSIEVPVVVSEQANPVFVTELKMNEYLVDGYKYILPQIKAIDYSDGAKEILAKVIVTDKEGTRFLEGLEYIPSIRNNNDPVKIVFTAEGKNGTSKIEKTVKVIKPVNEQNVLALENFFIKPVQTVINYEPNGMKFTFNGDSEMNFINPVIADSFYSKFRISNNASLEYLLTDKYDKEQVFKLKIYNDGTNIIVDANDTVSYTTKFNVAYANDLEIKLNVKDKQLSFGGKTVLIENMPAFDSEYAYVSWKIVCTDNQATTMLINEINGFRFRGPSELEQDFSGPQIVLYKEAVSSEYNGQITTARAVCQDILSTYATCYIRVLSPSSKVVSDINGIALDGTADASKTYTFLCAEYGIYTVVYTGIDGSNQTSSQTYMIRVWDDEAPTITVKEIAKNQKLNATVVLPDATVSDNVTASNKCTTFVSVKTPKGQVETVKNGRYTFKYAGEYTITYCAMDKNGNPVFYTYTVNVK